MSAGSNRARSPTRIGTSSPRRISAYTVGREMPSSSATSLIERSGERTSCGVVKIWEVMAPIEAPRKGSPTSADTSGELFADSRRRFREIQAALSELGEENVLPRQMRRDVWEALEQARENVSTVEAKRLQLDATSGHPLTVCFGRRVRRIPRRISESGPGETLALLAYGDGCGVVFVDSERRFARYCPKCREKPGRRFRDELVRRRAAADEGRIRVRQSWLIAASKPESEIAGWKLSCTGCGERFFAPTPQRRRCDRCRH